MEGGEEGKADARADQACSPARRRRLLVCGHESPVKRGDAIGIAVAAKPSARRAPTHLASVALSHISPIPLLLMLCAACTMSDNPERQICVKMKTERLTVRIDSIQAERLRAAAADPRGVSMIVRDAIDAYLLRLERMKRRA